jgi:hypothetical protein
MAAVLRGKVPREDIHRSLDGMLRQHVGFGITKAADASGCRHAFGIPQPEISRLLEASMHLLLPFSLLLG